jgi:hypothetical protein
MIPSWSRDDAFMAFFRVASILTHARGSAFFTLIGCTRKPIHKIFFTSTTIVMAGGVYQFCAQ